MKASEKEAKETLVVGWEGGLGGKVVGANPEHDVAVLVLQEEENQWDPQSSQADCQLLTPIPLIFPHF